MFANEIILLIVIAVSLLGLTILIYYIIVSRKETAMTHKIQNNYERLNKELVAGDQAVQNLTDQKVNKLNASLTNVAESVQNVSNSGGDTKLSGDLCINNLCFGSTSNSHMRVNLDDITGLTTKFMQNFAGVQSSVSTDDLTLVKNELEQKIDALQQLVQSESTTF